MMEDFHFFIMEFFYYYYYEGYLFNYRGFSTDSFFFFSIGWTRWTVFLGVFFQFLALFVLLNVDLLRDLVDCYVSDFFFLLSIGPRINFPGVPTFSSSQLRLWIFNAPNNRVSYFRKPDHKFLIPFLLSSTSHVQSQHALIKF